MKFDQLLEEAWRVRERAYAPYSKFQVGAALLAADGRIFCGCNVENISFGLTICAERAAVFAALSAGVREFAAVAIVSDSLEPVRPCGACRQVLAEFAAADMPVCSVNLAGARSLSPLGDLLPFAKTGILDRAMFHVEQSDVSLS